MPFWFYMTGRDETFDGPPPGVILHAHSIRYAIANGFTEYDFLRGNESYKYSFGVEERRIRPSVAIDQEWMEHRRQDRSPNHPGGLKEATQLHQARKLAQAERGYRQILKVEPDNADAIHRLGQLLAAKGDFTAAKRVFRTLTTVRPDAAKAWQCLGQVCERLGQHEEALRQHLECMRLQPGQADGFVAVARCMVKLGRMEEINTALLAAIEPASAPSVRNVACDSRRAPDRPTAGEHSVSA